MQKNTEASDDTSDENFFLDENVDCNNIDLLVEGAMGTLANTQFEMDFVSFVTDQKIDFRISYIYKLCNAIF